MVFDEYVQRSSREGVGTSVPKWLGSSLEDRDMI